MSDFLKQMAQTSAARAAAAPQSFTAADLDRPVHPLKLGNFDLIAEIKNRSPAEGELVSAGTGRTERAKAYVDGGAAAISVLTEPERFDGDLSHLAEVVDAISDVPVPVMRKDFLVEPVQVLEARAAGASGVLLIAAMLSDSKLEQMLDCAFEYGLFVLLESFDQADLERSARLLGRADYAEQAETNGLLIGINTRNLRTLEVDSERLQRFGPLLPGGITCVAESGQLDGGDAARARQWGYRMTLVGTALMREDNPSGLIAEMLQSGRRQ
jgi:indole-3-glycerol phosphate synthase